MSVSIYGRVGCLGSVVALHDIVDVELYVAGALRKVLPGLHASERDELEAEGIAVLYGLAGEWNGGGTFRGYASSLLGFRLIDAWRRLNRGSRSPAFRACVSLDAEQVRPGFDERRVTRMGDFTRAPIAA